MSAGESVDRPPLGRFLIVAAELALLLWVTDRLHVAEDFGFLRILPLVFVAFVVHAWLPRALRPPAFVAASFAAFGLVLGWTNALWLVGCGSALVAACHLPFRFGARVAVVALLGAGFAAVRMKTDPSPIPEVVLPILGSMFMFRIVLYLLHLRHQDAPASVWTRLGYFFLLPNVCFPLFPIVDYDAFRRRWYDDPDATRIYQKGVEWIARGLTHVVLYRLVYHHLAPAPTAIEDLGGVVRFAVTSYLLYLRISGQFHVVIGILCLFGFNLPRTHDLYFMAAGFNDLWRRVNIYWKDFLLRTTYYPVALRIRSWGPLASSITAVFVVIGVTWILHSYQWFWLRGTFPLTAVDGAFWGSLAALMALNVVWESKRTRRTVLARESESWRTIFAKSAAGVATFAAMSAMWSLLASASVSEWAATIAPAARVNAGSLVFVLGGAASLFVVFAVVHRVVGPNRARTTAFPRSLAGTLAIAGTLLAITTPSLRDSIDTRAGELLASLEHDRLNRRDFDLFERGYYERVLAMDRHVAQLWTRDLQRPADWGRKPASMTVHHPEGYQTLAPNLRTEFKRATVSTNRWGMRDRDYEKRKPRGTFRIALVGGSIEFGSGVDDDRVFEAVVERRLAGERAFAGVEAIEILNFSIGGNELLGRARLLEPWVFPFEPDVLIIPSVGARDGRKLLDRLTGRRGKTAELPFPELGDPWAEAGITTEMEEIEVERRLAPLSRRLVRRVYTLVASRCRERGIVPVWMYVPTTGRTAPADEVEEWSLIARRAGFETISLRDAYLGAAPALLQVAPWDGHPNVFGHARLADALYEELLRVGDRLGLERAESRADAGR